ncbi:MAG TPA: phosphate ABC transporter ATP-binding protein [Acidobacteriaceae bacterium]|jgi:putative ABC transport system ATP-binding protein|nr:phosphate ABC transporter ATP-binding protein [Acidobacteriaceae bacterium]
MKLPAVECAQLTRTVSVAGSARALVQDITFQLERGLVLAILGPSGAGKTSLLRMLNRLDEPTSGTVLLDGQDYRPIPPQELRRHMGMVMQRPYLFPGTVAFNIQYGPAQRGVSLSQLQTDTLLEQVGLANYGSQDARTLSGGESQRVAIARALANDPEVLLLDEPTSALDDVSKQAVESLLSSLVHARHLTCVWVTHDRAQARRVADLAVLLEAGRQVAFGQPETLKELIDA